ncbi:hypothetical protein BCR44DRAFT_1424119 [Catenaria anguillulae PL171]|uniref:Uncharacterized protein n=1 Tax=Catenaria anguillulae PL171 TaxID=765915 RepID=A0A1Y2I266_9FUNG|nr:hypothetical protein BCR44DRAFT_1424119 [Catenaria anguillulae PL171]
MPLCTLAPRLRPSRIHNPPTTSRFCPFHHSRRVSRSGQSLCWLSSCLVSCVGLDPFVGCSLGFTYLSRDSRQ